MNGKAAADELYDRGFDRDEAKQVVNSLSSGEGLQLADDGGHEAKVYRHAPNDFEVQ